MKKLSYLFLALIIGFMTSCGVTPEVQPVTEDFSLPLAEGTLDLSFTDTKLSGASPSVVAASGDNVNVSLLIKKTASGGKPSVLRVFVADQPNYRKTDQALFEIKLKNRDEQTQTIDFGVSATTGKNYLHFDVYNTDNKVTRKTLVINISADGQISSWTGIVLGAQGNAAGSRMASATGDIYKVCDLDSNKINLDFVDITYAAIGSPTARPIILSNPERENFNLATKIPASNTICGGGSTAGGKNSYFIEAPSSVDFATITDAQLGALLVSNTSSKSVYVEAGKTYAFLNSNVNGNSNVGKKGLIKVTAIEPGTGGKITFDVKVQK
jgi:hypothetical protein